MLIEWTSGCVSDSTCKVDSSDYSAVNYSVKGCSENEGDKVKESASNLSLGLDSTATWDEGSVVDPVV